MGFGDILPYQHGVVAKNGQHSKVAPPMVILEPMSNSPRKFAIIILDLMHACLISRRLA